ncbi:MAG: hypothetical protein ACUVV4_02810 [Candidatus Bathyarchaeia archaeon]
MSLGKTLAIRGLTLVAVLFYVLLLAVAVIGATGVSDRILNTILSEKLSKASPFNSDEGS